MAEEKKQEIFDQYQFLKNQKRVSWVMPYQDKIAPELRFGPPIYDEKKSTYVWRTFKKGFNWGFILSGVTFT